MGFFLFLFGPTAISAKRAVAPHTYALPIPIYTSNVYCAHICKSVPERALKRDMFHATICCCVYYLP